MKFANILISLAAATNQVSVVDKVIASKTSSDGVTIYNANAGVVPGAVGHNLRNHDQCHTFYGDCHSCVLAGCSPYTKGKIPSTVECQGNRGNEETPTYGGMFG